VNRFQQHVRELAEESRNGNVDAKETLRRELRRQLEPMVRRVVRTGQGFSPLERTILRVFRFLSEPGCLAHDFGEDELVATISTCVGNSILRRLVQKRSSDDTTAD
jgi:hypothetical protein